MKKLYGILFVVGVIERGVYGEGKKGRIMVVGGNVWCRDNGYREKYKNEGSIREIGEGVKGVLGV